MKNHLIAMTCLTLFMLALSVASVPAQGQGSTAAQEADALFQAQRWDESARAYEAITKTEATNGRAWFRLGLSLHSLGRYNQAIEAYQKGLKINPNPLAMYNLARSYARMNDREHAFEWFNKAFNAGFPNAGLLKSDPDLEGLRSDARFTEVLALADKLTRPCMYGPEYKQFDFWVGEWDVQNNGQKAGTNSVERILNGCVLLENWTSASGGTGKSFNFYDASTGKWQQTWVDSTGSVLNLTGEYKDNTLLYTGETRAKNGSMTMHRLSFVNLGRERVRQLWEQSTDDGKTWNVVWDGMYTRRK